MKPPGSVDQPPGARRHRARVYVNGTQRSEWFDTPAEAWRWLAACAAAEKETAGEFEGETLAKFAHKVLTRREVKGTVRDPESDWSRFRLHIERDDIGRMPLKAFRDSVPIFRWVKRIENKGLEPQTRRNCLNLLRVIFTDAHQDGLVKLNPCLGVRVKGKSKDVWTYLTREELPKLIEAFDPVERHVGATQIGMGVRPGELVTLRRGDVYLDDRPRVIVRYGKPPNKPTMTGAVRSVPLFGLSLVAMRSWLARPAPKKNPHDLVFPRVRGGFRDENHVVKWEVWKGILEQAGIVRRFRWYDLRHTCASWLVSGWWGRRWSLQEVKEMLGHSSIMVTQRYAHLAESAVEEAARATVDGQVSASQLLDLETTRALPSHTDETSAETDGAPGRIRTGEPSV